VSDSPTPPQGPRLKAIVEALVFAAEDPLTLDDLVDLFPDNGEESLRSALADLVRVCEDPGRGVQVIRVAGGYRMTTKGELGTWVRALFRSRNRRRLSAAALETLAIVAYRQPITTPEIQAIRGTDPSSVLEALLEKGLVRILGRKRVVGKPILYGTTNEFLSHFGLDSLEDLPGPEEFGALAPAGTAAPQESRQEAGAAGGSGPFQEEEENEDGNGDEEYDDDGDDEVERRDDGDDS
jgi:segregation and condensation protein B